MTSVTLTRTGQKMPMVGCGLWKVAQSTCADTVYDAIKSGYRLFDGACDYGNEKQAGEGIARAIRDGLVKREELFITTKLWCTFHAKEHVITAAKKQLADWGLEYIDLYLIHLPISLKYVDPAHRYPPEWFGDDGRTVELDNIPIRETWTEMEKLVDAGLVKNIGVCSTKGALLLDLLRYARIPPQVLQIEHHPYLTQEPLVRLAKTLNIAVTAFSSFGPQSFVEIDMDRGVKPLLAGHSTIEGIAQAHSKAPAQILLRWATQRGVAVIPKSNSRTRREENLASADFELTKDEIKSISALNQGIRFDNPADVDPRLAIFA